MREKRKQQFVGVAGQFVLREPDAVAQQPSVAHEQALDAVVASAERHAEDVHVAAFAMHVLVFLDAAQMVDLIPIPSRTLEGQGIGRGFHSGFELRQHVGAVAVQEEHRQSHVFGVAFSVDQTHAGAAATLYLILKAGARTVLEEAVRAGANAEELLQDIQAVAHRRRAGEWPEVAAGLLGAAMERQARIGMVGEMHIGVGFVVAQNDVEARSVGLDEALFQKQRFGFAAGDRDLDVAHSVG